MYRPSFAADVVTKVGHYGKCATATATIQPCLRSHYGQANTEVQQLHEQGKLNLDILAPRRPGADVAAEHDEGGCSSHLHCARPNSKAAGTRDVHGMLGACCMHGFPVVGSCVDLPAPENYSIYLVMLRNVLVAARGRVKDIYIDFGCRISKTWLRYLDHARNDTELLRRVRILVNWMHAAGHNMSCQLKNSGRHTEGAGWRVGEQTEQLWSLLKVRV